MIKKRLQKKQQLNDINNIRKIILDEEVNEKNLQDQVGLWQCGDDLVSQMKTVIELILNKGRKIDDLDFKYYKELLTCNNQLRDNIIDFAINNGYTLVKIDE